MTPNLQILDFDCKLENAEDRTAGCRESVLHGKRRESGIRFPALFLTLTFCLARPYLAGLNLFVALARMGPATKGQEAVELVTGNGTVK